ncbi:MAG TPA: S41 family peptidase [Candidatus Elarobacter sp.]|jgi:hypothetical protein
MRVRALLVAAALLVSTSPVSVHAAAQGQREDSFVALCRLWNAVRFFHPALTSETDERWDDALVAAEPILERDPTALREAAAVMLDALHDPFTTVEVDRKNGGVAVPSATVETGIRVVRLNGFPAPLAASAYAAKLGDAIAPAADDRGLVIDLRTGPGSFAQLDSLITAWSEAGLASRVIDAPIALPVLAQRYYLGFPSESGTASTDYHEGRQTTGPAQIVSPRPGARAVAVAFVIDGNSLVPKDAVALANAGRAKIFSVDGTSGMPIGEFDFLDVGGGLRAVVRVASWLTEPTPRRGTLDDARIWAGNRTATSERESDLPPARTPPVAIGARFASRALPDQAHRVLAAFRTWGSIAYFFPYTADMHDDWDAALRLGLVDLHEAETPLAYGLALRKMYAHLHDTHGYASSPAVLEAFAAGPALVARDIEGKPTVVRADPVAARRDGFAIGDVIEAVDGEPVAARIARLRPYADFSTEQSFRERFFGGSSGMTLLAGPAGSTVRIRVRKADGRLRDIVTARSGAPEKLYERTRPVVDVLPGNVAYADLARLELPQVDALVQRFSTVRAIVFDLRGYPRGTAWALAPHFTGERVAAALFRTPVRQRPIGAPGAGDDPLSYLNETRDFLQMISPSAPRLRVPVVVAIDARAVSQAEHTALFLRAAAHARFVGQATTGANGDVTYFQLPGGVTMAFTGQAVLHPNGGRLQRVGIRPDVPVAPTLRGVRSGDDELLTAALAEALRLGHADSQTTRRALAAERAAEHADAAAQMKIPSPAELPR